MMASFVSFFVLYLFVHYYIIISIILITSSYILQYLCKYLSYVIGC